MNSHNSCHEFPGPPFLSHHQHSSSDYLVIVSDIIMDLPSIITRQVDGATLESFHVETWL